MGVDFMDNENEMSRKGSDSCNSVQHSSHKMLASSAKQLTFRRAALVATASIERKVMESNDVRDAVDFNLDLLELKIACLTAETRFLDSIQAMDRESKELTMFRLFDRDGNGKIALHELAACFQKLDPTKAHTSNMDDAYNSICKADSDNDGLMDYDEFSGFLQDFHEAMECPFEHLCQLLVLWLCLKDDGKDILKESLASVRHQVKHEDPLETAHHRDRFDDEMTEARIALLFQMIDYQGQGIVLLQDVVERLYFVTKGMDTQTRKAMFMLDEDEPRELDFYGFSAIILNVVAAISYADFNDIADAMTLSACQSNKVTNKDLVDLFMSVDMKTALSQKITKHHMDVNAVQYSRMETLFKVWDEDKSGYLDFREFMLGLRKFQWAVSSNNTIDDAILAMVHFDKDQDQKLGIEEFAQILAKFAKAMKVALNELIDFMVVQSVMRDNDERDKEYVEKVKKQVMKKIQKDQPRAPIFSILAGVFQSTALALVSDMAQEVESSDRRYF